MVAAVRNRPQQKYFPTKSIPYQKTRKKPQKSPRNFLHGARITRTIAPFRPRIHRKALRRGGTGAGVGRVTRTFQPRGRAAISPVGREKGGGGFGPAVAAFPMSGPARHGLSRKTPFRVCGGSWRSSSPATGCTDSSSAPGRTRPQGLEAKVRRYTGTRCICPVLSMRQRGRIAGDSQAMDGGCDTWRRTDRWLRALRQNERSHPRRQMWPNWQATASATKPPSPGWVRAGP
ncbi:hypothetical protein J2Z84_000654 [Agrobacterium rubi]|nr:hypothetical protein [Agrobacterium rubi]